MNRYQAKYAILDPLALARRSSVHVPYTKLNAIHFYDFFPIQ